MTLLLIVAGGYVLLYPLGLLVGRWIQAQKRPR